MPPHRKVEQAKLVAAQSLPTTPPAKRRQADGSGALSEPATPKGVMSVSSGEEEARRGRRLSLLES